MASRPRFKTYFRPVRRGGGTVQLGLSAESGGIILTGLAAPEVAFLERLDGSLTLVDLYAVAEGSGVQRGRADELIRLLHQQRVLLGEPLDRADLRRLRHLENTEPGAGLLARTQQHVLVDGSGRLPGTIAGLLRSAGVSKVDLGEWTADVIDAQIRDGAEALPDLVLLIARGGVDPRLGEPWRRRGVTHLPVVGDGGRVVVGPLVGQDPALPCLACLQLTRADRDAEWPAVMAEAARHGREVDAEGTLASIAAGVAATIALAALAAEPVPAGVSVEVTLPWPRLDHRRWVRHPACPDHPVSAAARQAPWSAPARVRMTG